MSNPKRLGIYNPQLSDIKVLSSLLVKYQPLLNDLVTQHQQQKTLTLVSGPSGSGKTHLTRLFLAQMEQTISSPVQYKMVKLNVGSGELSSLIDFIQALLSALDCPIQELLPLPVEKAQAQALLYLQPIIEQYRLIVTIETLDEHLIHFTNNEQDQLAKWLQATPDISIFATASRPLASDNPLTKLFQSHQLTPLSLEHSGALMKKVALVQGKSDFATALSTPKGEVCIRALHHLAQGLPRLYVHFSSLVQAKPFEEFNTVIEQMLDALSVFHQQALAFLPSQQQKLVSYVAKQTGTVSVTQIAQHNRITHQTTSGQLKKLRDARLMVSTAVGRTSHYELAEPLTRMALALNVRPQQANAQINALRHWFACANDCYQAQDGQYFIYHKQALAQHALPKALPPAFKAQQLLQAFMAELPVINGNQFVELKTKLNDIAEDAYLRKDEPDQLNHLKLLAGLICHCLYHKQIERAQLLGNELFNFVTRINSTKLWKQLAEHSIAITAWFASLASSERTLPWLNQLERQEPKLSSQQFSISLSHCLVNKAKGYALAHERGKCQQALEQLRLRAEKRNCLEIAGTFCHAVKETMSFMALEDEKHATKLLRQVQDMSNKYRLDDLAFACASRLWSHCPEAMPLQQLVEMLEQVQTSDGFGYEIFYLLYTLAMQPLDVQIGGYVAIWHRLAELKHTCIYAAGLKQVSVKLAKNAPKRFDLWLYGCQSLLDNEASLAQSKRLLLAVQQYLHNNQDIHQLLVLPKEERALVIDALT